MTSMSTFAVGKPRSLCHRVEIQPFYRRVRKIQGGDLDAVDGEKHQRLGMLTSAGGEVFRFYLRTFKAPVGNADLPKGEGPAMLRILRSKWCAPCGVAQPGFAALLSQIHHFKPPSKPQKRN